jgi:hypothetical protein
MLKTFFHSLIIVALLSGCQLSGCQKTEDKFCRRICKQEVKCNSKITVPSYEENYSGRSFLLDGTTCRCVIFVSTHSKKGEKDE